MTNFKFLTKSLAPVAQRPDNFIQWINHYPTVSICAKISVFSLVQANIHTLTTASKFGSARKPWATFNVKYILDPELCLIHRIKLSGLWTTGAWCSVNLHLSKALFSLDPDTLQLHCFLGLGALLCCSFFCPLGQPYSKLHVANGTGRLSMLESKLSSLGETLAKVIMIVSWAKHFNRSFLATLHPGVKSYNQQSVRES